MRRDKLRFLLSSNKNCSLIVINAPAGYGKTILLNEYYYSLDHKICWLQTPRQIYSPYELLAYIVSSIKIVFPGFGNNTLKFLNTLKSTGKEYEITPILTAFNNEIINSDFKLITLIIDDYQNLESEESLKWVSLFFNELIENLPANLKIIISSRNDPLIKVSRLISKRNFFKITDKNLLFNFEEILSLLKTVYKPESSYKTASKILSLTNGWITGIHLLMQSKDRDSVFASETKIPSELYSFFYEDVFDGLAEVEKKFIINTAFLDFFTPSVSDILLSSNDSIDIINNLLRKNIFIEMVGTGTEPVYSYQKLFCIFIRQYIDKKLNHGEKAELLNKIASVLYSNNQKETALEHYLKAQNYSSAKFILNEIFDDVLENLGYQKLNSWLSAFPDEYLQSEPILLYFRLTLDIAENKIENGIMTNFDTLTAISKEKNPDLLLKIDFLRIQYFILAGRLDKSIELLNLLAKQNQKTENYIFIKLLFAKTLYRMGFEKYEEVLDISIKTIKEIDENNFKHGKIELLNYIANIYFDRGDILSSIKYSEQLLTLDLSINDKYTQFTRLVYFYCSVRNFEKAYSYYYEAEIIFNKYPSKHIKRLFTRCKYLFHNSIGDHKTAIEVLNDSYSLESVRSNKELLWAHYISLAESYYYSANIEASWQMLKLSRELSVKDDGYKLIIDKFCEYVYCCKYADSDKFEETMKDIYRYHSENRIDGVLHKILFYLAEYYIKNQNYETSILYLSDSINKTCDLNDLAFAENQLLLSRPVFDFAISCNIQKKFIQDLYLGITERVNLSFITPEFKAKLINDLTKLTDLRLLSFGNMELYLRGEVIPEDKWIRKKSKIMLAYLLANEGIVLTKDKAIDMFFPGLPMDKAEVALHSTVYNIRTALRIYDIKSDKPKRSKTKEFDYNPQYIIYEDKMIRLNKDFHYSADNVEFEKLYHKIKLPSIDTDEKIKLGSQAIELYRGEFLPGNYESWCEEKRIDYKNMFIDLSEELIVILENEKKYDEAIKYSASLIAEDNINEKGHLCLVSSYAAMGNINMARDRFQLMLKVFDEELGEKPSAKTLDKIKEILS